MMTRRALIVLALVLAPLTLAPVGPASAAGYTVNSSGDAADANLADPACATATGVCTLRAAIEQANATAGTDVVTVPAMTISLGSPLTISSNLTLRGAGARGTILQATGGAHGMLLVTSGVVVVSGVTVTGATGGGALAVSQSGGDLTLRGLRVTNNVASGPGGGYGPVYTINGTLTVRDSEISGNSTTSTSSNAFGGGLSAYSSTVTVLNTTIADNTLASGSAQVLGGGVWAGMNSTVTLTSSTIAGNAVSGNGTFGSGVFQNTGGSGSIEIADSVLALPQGHTNCAAGGKLPVFVGRNLLDDASCGAADATRTLGPTRLGPLADNGGQTNTRVPGPGSLALNAASACATPTDQRGQARPIAGRCDLGAAESGSNRKAAVSLSNRRPSAGSDVVATVTALNKGLDHSTSTRLTVRAPRAKVLSATVLGGSCRVRGDRATCKLGTVAGGTSKRVLVVLRMPASGTVAVRAKVAGAQADPVKANNQATVKAVVRAR